MDHNKKVFIMFGFSVGVVLLVGFVVFYVLNFKPSPLVVAPEIPNPDAFVLDVNNMSYVVEDEIFHLKNGTAINEGAPGTLSKSTLSIFGEPAYGDFDTDGDTDAAIWLVNDSGGTGKFYYAVLDMNMGTSYKPTNAMFLGDRIAPQSLNVQEGRAVYNFAQRRENDPMTAEPTVGKTIWVHYDKNSGEIGEWVKDFEGEADPDKMTLGMKSWNWISTTYPAGQKIVPLLANKFTVSLKKDGTFSASTDCNGIGGNYVVKNKNITFSDMLGTLMYCEGSQEGDFKKIFEQAESFYFTSKGELIFTFKGGSGIATFR
ncbi:MAG: META domain-containing protein [Patescibacteria group bacterium]